MVKLIRKFFRDESGAIVVEYALILTVLGASMAVAAVALGSAISIATEEAATEIANCSDGC